MQTEDETTEIVGNEIVCETTIVADWDFGRHRKKTHHPIKVF
jgi:hypothetical protein